MNKTAEMKRLEIAYGKDIRVIIQDAINQHGSVGKAAGALGLTRGGLYSWIYRLNGRLDTVARVEFGLEDQAA